jgi:cobalt-zinc-cadmium efflux system outer membrane protein
VKIRGIHVGLTLLLAPWLAGVGSGGAPAIAEPPVVLTFQSYLAQTAHSNLELLAQHYAIPIAEAQIAVAKVFPDAVVAGGISQVDVSGQSAPLISTLGVTLPLELGGKRAGRIAVAQSDVAVTQAEFAEALRQKRAEAALAYVNALASRLVLSRKQQTLASLQRLVTVNEKRLQSGDIGEVPLIQSRVESQRFRADVLAAEADQVAADLALRLYLGQAAPPREVPLHITGELRIPPHTFAVEELITSALEHRPDVLAKRRAEDAAAARISLAQRNRMVDLSVNLSWQRSLLSEPFASPQYDALSAIVSLPLPLSRIYHGELDAARGTAAQASLSYQAVTLRAQVEIQQSLVRYQSTVQQLGLYTQGVLSDAEHVHTATLFSYQRGGATLLEVLSAQRTVDEVYLSYYGALAEHARQLIAVEQAAAIWDINM